MTLSITVFSTIILSVTLYCFAECHYAECRYAECRGAQMNTPSILDGGLDLQF